MINLSDYEVTNDNIGNLVNVELGLILNPFVSYKGWSKIETLCNIILPNIDYNAKFYRKKNIHKCKTLHTTNELEIIDIEQFKSEVDNHNGEIEQYIGDGEIITELTYFVKEDSKAYLKRIIKELKESYNFYSKRGYERRFYIEGMTDLEKVDFTKLVLSNALTLIEYLEGIEL